jgi:hypothetical protein
MTGKMYNKKSDEACADLKVTYKRGWKFYAIYQVQGSRIGEMSKLGC